jgi:hypothetical protein
MEALYAEHRALGIGIRGLAINVITTCIGSGRLYERLGAVPFLTTYAQRVPAGGLDGH